MVAVRDDENITDAPEVETADDLVKLHWKRRMYWANVAPNYHACIACVFGVEPRTLPAKMTGKASVTSDRYIMCSGVKPDGETFTGGFVGDFGSFQAAWRNAARAAHLTDEEKAEFSQWLNDWLSPTTNYGGVKFQI